MEASPLTQQSRPETFKPKIVQLYEDLFNRPNYADPGEGFWREFFLLRPEGSQLRQLLERLHPDEILNLQTQTQHLFARGVREASSGVVPNNTNALEALTVFLASVLKKKYTNPSSDVITVLAGLDEVDRLISEFVVVLDSIIRNGGSFDIRLKAIRAATAMISGAYKTSLVSFFIHRDLFPSLMKFIHECDALVGIAEPFILLGLLANYNKFEFENPYQLRLNDFVNETAIQKIVRGLGQSCAGLRNDYVAVQDDIPEGWTISNTLTFLGLRAIAPRAKSPPTAEEAKDIFTALPAREAAILLAAYDFVNSNKLFGYHLINLVPDQNTEESPFASFLSLTSYLLQHAYRSVRVTHYGELNLFVLRILVEDPTLCKQICNEDCKRRVRLCRQRQPYLPVVNGERVIATVLFDIIVDAISHNLRRRLDTNLYSNALAILLRLLTYISQNKIRLTYHWAELWRTLLSLMRFSSNYASDLSQISNTETLVMSLVDVLAFCVSAGDTFLPDPASYDDLFYKIVENGPIISKFREVYSPLLAMSTKTLNAPPPKAQSSADATQIKTHAAALETLITVSTHFHSLLFSTASDAVNSKPVPKSDGDSGTKPDVVSQTMRKKNLSPHEVHRIIKQGYDTLSVQPPDGLSVWEKWRETDRKAELKRAARVAVEDARKLVA